MAESRITDMKDFSVEPSQDRSQPPGGSQTEGQRQDPLAWSEALLLPDIPHPATPGSGLMDSYMQPWKWPCRAGVWDTWSRGVRQ